LTWAAGVGAGDQGLVVFVPLVGKVEAALLRPVLVVGLAAIWQCNVVICMERKHIFKTLITNPTSGLCLF
jgi:hypothetical protein